MGEDNHGTSRAGRMGFLASLFLVSGVICVAMIAFPDADAEISEAIADIAESGVLVQDEASKVSQDNPSKPLKTHVKGADKASTIVPEVQEAQAKYSVDPEVAQAQRQAQKEKARLLAKAARQKKRMKRRMKRKQAEMKKMEAAAQAIKKLKRTGEAHLEDVITRGKQRVHMASLRAQSAVYRQAHRSLKDMQETGVGQAARKAARDVRNHYTELKLRAADKLSRYKLANKMKLERLKFKHEKKRLKNDFEMKSDRQEYRKQLHWMQDDQRMHKLRLQKARNAVLQSSAEAALERKMQFDKQLLKLKEKEALLKPDTSLLKPASSLTQIDAKSMNEDAQRWLAQAKKYDHQAINAIEHQDVLGAKVAQELENKAFEKAKKLQAYKVAKDAKQKKAEEAVVEKAKEKHSKLNDKRVKKAELKIKKKLKELKAKQAKEAGAEAAAEAAKLIKAGEKARKAATKVTAKAKVSHKSKPPEAHFHVPESMKEQYQFFRSGRNALWQKHEQESKHAGLKSNRKEWKKETEVLWKAAVRNQWKTEQASAAVLTAAAMHV